MATAALGSAVGGHRCGHPRDHSGTQRVPPQE